MKRHYTAFGILLVAVLVLAGGAYWFLQKPTSTESVPVSTPTADTTRTYTCPPTYNNKSFLEWGLYDGKPAELVQLKGDERGRGSYWSLEPKIAMKEGYYFGCVYEGTTTAQYSVKLDRGFKSCTTSEIGTLTCTDH